MVELPIKLNKVFPAGKCEKVSYVTVIYTTDDSANADNNCNTNNDANDANDDGQSMTVRGSLVDKPNEPKSSHLAITNASNIFSGNCKLNFEVNLTTVYQMVNQSIDNDIINSIK